MLARRHEIDFGLAAALLASRLALAGEPFLPSAGAVVTNVIPIAGKQVPLPEGPWIVAGAGHTRWASEVEGAYGAIANLVLFRLQGRVVDAALELNVNELAVMDGWGIAADCMRGDLALAVVRYRTGWDESCFFVTHTLAVTPGIPPAWDQALRLASDADLIMAPVWLSTGFRVSNRRDIIDARFHFSPSTRGIPVEISSSWSDSAWHGDATRPRSAALDTGRDRCPLGRGLQRIAGARARSIAWFRLAAFRCRVRPMHRPRRVNSSQDRGSERAAPRRAAG